MRPILLVLLPTTKSLSKLVSLSFQVLKAQYLSFNGIYFERMVKENMI